MVVIEGTGSAPGAASRSATETARPLMGALALSARDIVVHYGGVAAVRGVSIDLHAGEIVGLIGPNGAGKSSALGALGGQIGIKSGSITLAAQRVDRLAPFQRARLGITRTFQSTSEFGGMTVFENLITAGHGAEGAALSSVVLRPRSNRETARAVARHAWEVLDRFEMAEIADAYGRELSGGQCRLVEIMRSLMRRPQVLLLDEPMVGVAPHLVAKLVTDLTSIAQDGIALLIVEHALEVVAQLCDRVVVMAQGVVICEGSFAEVVEDPDVRDAYLG